MTQKATGELLGVTESSVWNWERQGLEPEFCHLPKIIAFLGYDPRPEPRTIGERLVAFRKAKGWAQWRLAEEFGVDQTTLGRWERGTREPSGPLLERVEKLFEQYSTNED